MDEWSCRKLRCVRLKQRKRGRSMISFLVSLGVPPWRAELLQLGRRRLALLGGLTLVADDLREPVTFLLLVGDLLRHELELDGQPTVRI